MPEGDTIHKLADRVRHLLAGERLGSVRIQGRRFEVLEGQLVDEVTAVGKHMLLTVGDRVLRTHLGMHGKWLHGDPTVSWRGPAWRISVRLTTDRLGLLCIDAKEVDVLDLAGQRFRAWLRRLGPDLGRPTFEPALAASRARERLPGTAPLVDVLLDQRVASGIGNVYKSETLFLGRCHPERRLDAIDDMALAGLFERASTMLRANLRPGPRRTRAPRPSSSADRTPDDPALWVYGRGGEPCFACRTEIRHRRLGRNSRATWWCPACQA